MTDVAKAAGVSKSTVSRVLNGKDIVSEEVKASVYKAIQETGYRPNLLAQQLATQKSRMIGFVMTNTLYDGPYFSTLVYGAAACSEKYQHQLIFADGKHSADEEKQAIDCLVGMKCAGIIVYPGFLTTAELDEIITRSPVPIVVLNRQLDKHPGACVALPHYASAALMVAHLLDCGHQHIAFLSGNRHSPTNEMRLEAWRDGLSSRGIALGEEYIVQGNWTMESGYQSTCRLLESNIPFSAILAGNDDMALGAMKALQDSGYRIPEDCSVAGFDNARVSAFVSPGLTTVNIPLIPMVQQAVAYLLGIPQVSESSLAGELIIRHSVGAVVPESPLNQASPAAR
ncbi:LacI family DNA-binding transcriptional regulator [Shimwellia pseudoproteus]|uniref:LacI family DNA-binding transcriptional regulator n=1 Tax=Shimwellia pseudoproteus TaxID=570012 RepID=UPI0018EE1261|nr:LacI family DNA-binding transcriptional regulator [Shimwellia pseudoproteus]